jgi:hypothetical protein
MVYNNKFPRVSSDTIQTHSTCSPMIYHDTQLCGSDTHAAWLQGDGTWASVERHVELGSPRRHVKRSPRTLANCGITPMPNVFSYHLLYIMSFHSVYTSISM